MEEERPYAWFQQGSATVHTANDALATLKGAVVERIRSPGFMTSMFG
jgi:hypothetical protein